MVYRRFGACCALVALLGCDNDRRIPETTLTDAEIALHMQCHDKRGLTAYARDGKRTYVSCYQGKKRIWIVKL
jgi:hypothetical protein